MRRYTFASYLIVAFSGLPVPASAENSELVGDLYIEGVQAYFAGQSQRADAYLSRAISGNPYDPRAYYFRALSRVREGRQSEAQADMRTGATLEARLANRFDVGKTLERVQGPARLALEEHRRNARIKAGMNPQPGPLKQSDAAVLRERRVVPLDEFSHSGVPRSIVVPEAVTTEAVAPISKTTPPRAKAPEDPFNDDAAAAPASKSPPSNVPPASTPTAKAAALEAPLPPQPKEASQPPQPAKEKDDNPFLPE